jgi:hypothetical protein
VKPTALRWKDRKKKATFKDRKKKATFHPLLRAGVSSPLAPPSRPRILVTAMPGRPPAQPPPRTTLAASAGREGGREYLGHATARHLGRGAYPLQELPVSLAGYPHAILLFRRCPAMVAGTSHVFPEGDQGCHIPRPQSPWSLGRRDSHYRIPRKRKPPSACVLISE